MSIDKIASIESVLQQMRAMSDVAQGVFPSAQSQPVSQSSGGFAAELQRTIRQLADMQNASSAQAKAFVAGEPGIALNDVMVDMQKAGIAFQATLQMRNRIIAAYQEIASMQV